MKIFFILLFVINCFGQKENIVFLHSYNSNSKEFLRLGNKFDSEKYNLVFLQGKYSTGGDNYCWASIQYNAKNKSWNNIDELKKSEAFVLSQIMNLHNITIIGYSQGAILALAVGINNYNKIKRIVCLNGYLERFSIRINELNKNNVFPEILLLNGRNDQIIDPNWIILTKELLKSNNILFQSIEHNNGHAFTLEQENTIINWVKK